jgi:uncharacterized protein involved in type VI secretion and phage assembly
MDDRLARFVERMANRYWGKYRGLVEDRNDPEHLGRLKVKVPSVLGDAVSGWAWPATPYGGAGIGLFALPAKGDMVWVEFAEGELDQPLWTGCAWGKPGGTTEIPKEADQGYPDHVVLKTGFGHVIVLSDESGKEQITVRAKSGCEVMIDPNANRVTVEAGEVIVQTSGGAPEELATKSFVQQVFDTHTHATGVGPSAPPVPTSTPTSLTNVLKAD